MTVARHNLMTAKKGGSDALCEAIRALVVKARTMEGFEGAVLLRDCDRPDQLVFVERWSSLDVYASSREVLETEGLAAVTALLAGPPTSAYAEYVQL